MNLKRIYIFICSLILTLAIQAQEKNSTKLLTKENRFSAGDTVVLEFNTVLKKDIKLYVSNSYGNTIINAKKNKNKLRFIIPSFITVKKGVCTWTLFNLNNKLLNGNIYIQPKQKPVSIETYLGPPSIEAGGRDFTMLVVIPTDSLDNPLKDSTNVTVQKQFLSTKSSSTIQTANLIGYKRIYSPLKSGRVLLSSNSNTLDSKEYDVNIMPAIAKNFKIFYKRIHEFADGNQITTFYTSILKDENNNVVSDGTFVDFFIKNKEGVILKTSGTTIKGIAYAKMLHPEAKDNWSVNAIVTGISESNSINISYKSAVTDFGISFSSNNRIIKVGPIKSFMNQIIPDGLLVSLKVIRNGKEIQEIKKPSRSGFALYELEKAIYKDGNYTFIIESAGIQKKFESKKIW